MTGPLQLFPTQTAIRLTDRQQGVMDALTAAGADGLTPEQAGAHLRAHRGDQRPTSEWDKPNGLAVLRRLRQHGLAAERRKPYTRYVAVGQEKPRADFGEVPY